MSQRTRATPFKGLKYTRYCRNSSALIIQLEWLTEKFWCCNIYWPGGSREDVVRNEAEKLAHRSTTRATPWRRSGTTPLARRVAVTPITINLFTQTDLQTHHMYHVYPLREIILKDRKQKQSNPVSITYNRLHHFWTSLVLRLRAKCEIWKNVSPAFESHYKTSGSKEWNYNARIHYSMAQTAS